jgi:hypothetical protein
VPSQEPSTTEVVAAQRQREVVALELLEEEVAAPMVVAEWAVFAALATGALPIQDRSWFPPPSELFLYRRPSFRQHDDLEQFRSRLANHDWFHPVLMKTVAVVVQEEVLLILQTWCARSHLDQKAES